MNKSYIVIGVGLTLAFVSGFYGDIVGDLTTMGVSPAVIDIGQRFFERAVEAVAGVALMMHIVLPNIGGKSN